MVGRSSASIPAEVIRASSSDAVMASTSSGSAPMLVKALRVRGLPIPTPRVANSTMAAIGSRKKRPSSDVDGGLEGRQAATAASDSCAATSRRRHRGSHRAERRCSQE